MPSQVASSKARRTMEIANRHTVEAEQDTPTMPMWVAKFASMDVESLQRAKNYSLRFGATFGRMLENQELIKLAMSVVDARFMDEAWARPICMEAGCVGYDGRAGFERCWDCKRKQLARWRRRENSEQRLLRVQDILDRQSMAELGLLVQEAREDPNPVFKDLIESMHPQALMMDWQHAADHFMSSKK